jgi:hypothetical protein
VYQVLCTGYCEPFILRYVYNMYCVLYTVYSLVHIRKSNCIISFASCLLTYTRAKCVETTYTDMLVIRLGTLLDRVSVLLLISVSPLLLLGDLAHLGGGLGGVLILGGREVDGSGRSGGRGSSDGLLHFGDLALLGGGLGGVLVLRGREVDGSGRSGGHGHSDGRGRSVGRGRSDERDGSGNTGRGDQVHRDRRRRRRNEIDGNRHSSTNFRARTIAVIVSTFCTLKQAMPVPITTASPSLPSFSNARRVAIRKGD